MRRLSVALVGSPNSGKTTLFNQLTGLNQKTGNYPGVTVEKKDGIFRMENREVHLLDLPGTHSLYPTSLDESLVVHELVGYNPPDAVIVILDVQSLSRNLLLFSQVFDLEIPTILVLNMTDRSTVSYDIELLSEKLQVPIIETVAKKGIGLPALKEQLLKIQPKAKTCFYSLNPEDVSVLNKHFPAQLTCNPYTHWHQVLLKLDSNPFRVGKATYTETELEEKGISIDALKKAETFDRYNRINIILKECLKTTSDRIRFTDKLDRFLLHPIGGYFFFFIILFLVFQAVFSWATYPMDWIDTLFANLSVLVKNSLPSGAFTNLIAEGIVPGIGGVVIFVPQIAFLFLFLTLLEQSGYLSRVVFLMDKFMRKFGLHGKSVVPLLSGLACAIPAIMSARTIGNWRERLITILVTPFMTCSARLPVYAILIALIVPNTSFGIFNLQGVMLMVMYLIGFLATIGTAFILKKLIVTGERSILAMEMPTYKIPSWKNTFFTIYDKTKTFVFEAGKIILSISVILWVLSNYGVGEQFNNAEAIVKAKYAQESVSEETIALAINTQRLEHSFAGYFGKAIEPAIRPLGYDWKIGIALITSFAAREVFVGSIATIYSIGEDFEDPVTIKARLAEQIDPRTGQPIFNFATVISLLLFYAFAMQCMSTVAIVRRETYTWKWALLQMFAMSSIAYITALVAYQLLK